MRLLPNLSDEEDKCSEIIAKDIIASFSCMWRYINEGPLSFHIRAYLLEYADVSSGPLKKINTVHDYAIVESCELNACCLLMFDQHFCERLGVSSGSILPRTDISRVTFCELFSNAWLTFRCLILSRTNTLQFKYMADFCLKRAREYLESVVHLDKNLLMDRTFVKRVKPEQILAQSCRLKVDISGIISVLVFEQS